MRLINYIIFLVTGLLIAVNLNATHNRAGEIVYTRIEPFYTIVAGSKVPVYHYSITVIRYTDDNPGQVADRCEDTIHFGDGEFGIAKRINDSPLGCNCFNAGCGEIINSEPDHRVKLNIYTITHYYAGPGTYTIYSYDPNRNQGVQNIPNSVNLPFYLEAKLVIDAYTGPNTSPRFAFAPIDKGCLRNCFEHNAGAYDPDGDSLSYKITMSRGAGGDPVPGYTFPQGSYSIDEITGELRWCSPQLIGEYNLAFIVYEWRKNTNGEYYQIGYVLRDMQVIIENCSTKSPPLAEVPPDTCVEAGTLISKNIFITDADGGRVTVTGGGGAFEGIAPQAALSNNEGSTASGGFNTQFSWQTSCEHVRRVPYQITIKTEDDDNPVQQVSFSSFNIRVMPPSIKNIVATAAGTSIRLDWSAPNCTPQSNPLIKYLIYRRNSCDSLTFSPCGPELSKNGYSLIASVGKGTTFFVDSANGDGLVVGQNYSYIITGLYEDGLETFAGAGVCSELSRDVPVILNVDVQATSQTDGVVFVRWAVPVAGEGNFDTIAHPGPYIFRLLHQGPGAAAVPVFSTTAQHLPLLKTSFTHSALNTVSSPHEYQVEFLAGGNNAGHSQKARSVFLEPTPDDGRVYLEWESKTPWQNELYRVFRKEPGAASFSLITETSLTSHTDSVDLKNGFEYCYRVESEGAYSDPGILRPLINNSQEVCVSPEDRTAPCTPTVDLVSDCPGGYVRVSWTDVMNKCRFSNDLDHYVLYYKKIVDGEYTQLAAGRELFHEIGDLEEVSGCYAVQVVDTNGNASPLSAPFCVDNCPVFELPNIFTPNGDGNNDAFKAIRVRQIKKISLFIVDRWGNQVYETSDPFFEWDGVSSVTNNPCSEGTFFYVCEVFEPRLRGIVKRTLTGTVHLAR